METTRNTLRAAMAALSAMAVALVAVILVSVHPVFASAAEEPVQGVAEGNISLSVPATTLPCALTADGTVITPDADKYAFVNTGSVAVSIASPEVKLSNGVHDVNMSAKAAVVATTDKNQFKKLFNESDKQIDWILNNQGQGEQTLMQGQSLCVKFGIDPLTYDKNANVIEQAATSGGCNIASVNYAYREKRMPAYAVFFDNRRTAKLYKGYDRPVKGEPYRGSTEPVFDFVDDIENDKAEVFVPYKDVLERVSVETEDGEIQPTTTKGWFKRCSKLAGVEGLSKLDTSKVTDMGYMFYNCWRLTSLQLSGFDTSSVTNMRSMFEGCGGLGSLQLSSFNTTNVTDMGFMFWDCGDLTSLNVSKFDTSSVTNMGSMFWGCRGLTSLDVSKFDTANVMNMGYMFLACSGLTSLDLSSFNTSSVKNMYNMFYECSGLKQVTLKEGWSFKFADCSLPKTMYVKDGNGSFAEYTGGFPTTKTDTYYTENGIKQAFAVVYDDGNGGRAAKLYNRAKVPAAGDTFEGVAVTEVITGIENKPGAFEDKDGGKKLTKVEVVDDGIQPLTTKKWFSGCSKLASVEGLSKLDTSKATDMSGMFSSCGGLTSLDVSKFDTAKVTDMSFMFQGCSGVTLLDVSKFDTAKVTNMSFMFQGCWGLTSLVLSSFDTAKVTDMSTMFHGCSGLTSLVLSSFDTANATSMADMFQECSGLTSLDLSSFDTAKVMYMDYMFYECSGLTSLNLSSFDTAKVVYMGYMFEQCNKLNTVTFPNDAASKTQLKKALSDCGITPRSNQRTIDEDANALSASDNMESHQCEEGVEHRNLQYVGAVPLSGSTASAAANAPSSNVGSAGKTEADSPGQFGGSESKEPSAEKADNCQPDSDGNLSSDKSGSSAHMK